MALISINRPNCPTAGDDFCCDESVAEFEVIVSCAEPPRPVYVNIYNLDCECVEIYRSHESCCDGAEVPLRCGGKQNYLKDTRPDIVLTIPGRYKFRTVSGEFFEPEVKWEVTPINIEFAKLRLQELALCCCQQGRKA